MMRASDVDRIDGRAAEHARMQVAVGAAVITISSSTRPRSMVVMAGVSRSHMPVSQTSARSALSSALLAARKAGSEGEPGLLLALEQDRDVAGQAARLA